MRSVSRAIGVSRLHRLAENAQSPVLAEGKPGSDRPGLG